jgi:hypothetical protein
VSQLWFDPTFGFVPLEDDGEPWSSLVDPTLAREEERGRWEARAAQWRARALAEAVFGGEVEARLSGHTTRGPFRGLLHLRVPFPGGGEPGARLAEHRAREAAFLTAAARDPVLVQVPFLYVFAAGAPAPLAAPAAP